MKFPFFYHFIALKSLYKEEYTFFLDATGEEERHTKHHKDHSEIWVII